MSSSAINTVIKMMESLSEDKQNELVEHLREYLQDLQEEEKWQNSFDRTQDKTEILYAIAIPNLQAIDVSKNKSVII